MKNKHITFDFGVIKLEKHVIGDSVYKEYRRFRALINEFKQINNLQDKIDFSRLNRLDELKIEILNKILSFEGVE